MSNNHTGNVQPAIDAEEHTHISGVAGKKVFNIDTNGNVIDFTDVGVKASDSPSIDAFGRWRISDTANRLDVEFSYDGQEDIIDKVLGGNGTDTYDSNARHHVLANVATDTTDFAGIYSYDVPYTPGNSQLIAITGVLDFAGIGGGIAQLFLRSDVTGSIEEEVIDQADWDNPVSDVDWTTSQIFEIDFQSLRVGRIRFYLNRSGITTKVHEITNDNKRNTGYWAIPNHPIYWRIYNDATYTYMEIGYGDTDNAVGFRYRIAKNASAEMVAICATVKSEGGRELFDMPGYNRAADRGVTAKTISTTLVPLISIRPRTTFHSIKNKTLTIPSDFSIQTNNAIKIAIIHNSVLSNASWSNVDLNESCMEFDTNSTALANGHILNTDYIVTNKNTTGGAIGLMGRSLLWNRRGTDTGTLTIAAIRTTGTDAAVLGGIRWREIR